MLQRVGGGSWRNFLRPGFLIGLVTAALSLGRCGSRPVRTQVLPCRARGTAYSSASRHYEAWGCDRARQGYASRSARRQSRFLQTPTTLRGSEKRSNGLADVEGLNGAPDQEFA